MVTGSWWSGSMGEHHFRTFSFCPWSRRKLQQRYEIAVYDQDEVPVSCGGDGINLWNLRDIWLRLILWFGPSKGMSQTGALSFAGSYYHVLLRFVQFSSRGLDDAQSDIDDVRISAAIVSKVR